MPECVLEAYAEHLPRLQAQQLRDLSFVAAFPHMGKSGAQNWLQGLRKAMRRVSSAADSLFSFNGQPITVSGLRKRLGSALGGGFADE